MKSRLPDHPVAITGLPSNIASAGTRPNPSLRCNDSTTSAAAVSARGVPARQCPGFQPNVGRAGNGGLEPGEVLRRVVAIADLQHENPVDPVAERFAKGGDRAQRVLPFERRREVEGGQHHDRRLGQTEIAAAKPGRSRRDGGERRRHHANPAWRQRHQRIRGESRRRPYVMNETRPGTPFRRGDRQFPCPEADHAAAPCRGARQPSHDQRQQRRVDVQNQRRTRWWNARRNRWRRNISRVRGEQRPDVDRPDGHPQRFQRTQCQSRTFTQTGSTG